MRSQTFCSIIAAIFIALCSPSLAPGTNKQPLPFDIDQWLGFQNRKDFSWNVDIGKPYLTFQQRFVVPITASIRCDNLPDFESRHDLHFVLKIAAENAGWTEDYSYTNVPIPPRSDVSRTVNFSGGAYLRPGRYTMALIVYDSVSRKGNVLLKPIEVSRLKGDKLPELDRNIEAVEFVSEEIRVTRIWAGGEVDAPLATGREWLPVNNNPRLCIDIVVNISPGKRRRNPSNFSIDYLNPVTGRQTAGRNTSDFGRIYTDPVTGLQTVSRNTRDSGSGQLNPINIQMPVIGKKSDLGYSSSDNVLQTASVLSHLGLRNGLIRVSVLDALNAKTLVERRDADGFDWKSKSQALLYQDSPDTVDFKALNAQTEASAYLRDRLLEIVEEDTCTDGSPPPLKIVIIVSGSMKFAKRTPIRQLTLPDTRQDSGTVQFYYLRVPPNMDNDLGRMLKPVKPKIYTLSDSRSFRSALAELIAQFEKLK